MALNRTNRRRIALAGLAVLCVLAAASCKEGDPLSVESLGVRPDFQEEPATVSNLYVAFEKESVNGQRITLNVVVTDVNEPVTGIALKLSYPHDFSRFRGCVDGDLFPAPGTCFFAEPDPGTVFIARSITSPDQAVSVSGSKTIVQLEFLVFGEADGTIDIQAPNIGGSDASALLDVNGKPILVSWFSGTLSGR